ncbi:MAG: DUF3737 family protein [Oscillospiraceae bacterium]|nr:DUF3737 family protein [Oscillospiraceae bacterium]MBQ9208823.1 DUF3737 family protein [Oscillospiraceae bacterium]MBQ9210053.1 DUF3737 family protein [Oscillospiraceae bacterium]
MLINDKLFDGERALYKCRDTEISGCVFETGESPLKSSQGIKLDNVVFRGKYPLWYAADMQVNNSLIEEGARAGIWYTDNISIRDTLIEAPKSIRRCKGVYLDNVTLSGADETLWECSDIKLSNVRVRGDYLCMNSSDIEVEGLDLSGKYCFDGVQNVTVRNSRFLGRDTFWNSRNVTVYDSFISGAYIGWNSEDITFVNCTIESLQGMCYMTNLKMENCRLINTTLAFEYSTVYADLRGNVSSIINPTGGRIEADHIDTLIMDKDMVDITKTEIIAREGVGERLDKAPYLL